MALSQTAKLVEFFGVGLNHVNPVVLRIAMKEDDRPEWIRRRPKLNNLPRWDDTVSERINIHDRIKPGEVGERVRWIVETLHKGWFVDHQGFAFESAAEAIHFKMLWS